MPVASLVDAAPSTLTSAADLASDVAASRNAAISLQAAFDAADTAVQPPRPRLVMHTPPDIALGLELGCTQTQWGRLCQMLHDQDRVAGVGSGNFTLAQAQVRRPQDALLLARYFVLLEPSVPEHYTTLAALYRIIGRPDAVLENIVKAVARGLSGATAYGAAASLLWQADYIVEARDMFERAVARPEAEEGLWLPYASVLLCLGDFAKAAKAFLRVEANLPLPPVLCLALGRSQLASGDLQASVLTHKRCLERLDASDDAPLAPGTIDTRPRKMRGSAWAALAAAYARLNQVDRAHEAIVAALNAGISADDAAFNVVAAAQFLGDADLLHGVAVHAFVCSPDSTQAHALLGGALWEAGAVPEAVQAWERVLALGSADFRTLTLLGQGHLLLGDAARATVVFEQASALQPQSVDAWMCLGRSLASQARPDRAAVAFTRATQIEPGSAALWTELADAHLAARTTKRACEALHKACKLSPTHTALHQRLVNALLKSDAPRHVLRRALESVAALAPTHIDTRVRLGSLLTELRHYDAAAVHLRAALDTNAEHAPSWRAMVALLMEQLRRENRHAPLAPVVATALETAEALLVDAQADLPALQVQAQRLKEAGARVSLDAMAYLLNADLMREVPRPADTVPATLARVSTVCNGQRVEGQLLGHSFDGRGIVLREDGSQVWSDWTFTIESPAAPQAPTIWHTLMPSSRVYQPLGALASRLETVLATEVSNGVTLGDFMRVLHAYGHTCMLAGGQVRDALGAVCSDEKESQDIDIVTSALPTLVHQIASSMFGQKHITSPWPTVYHGVVRVAGKLDIATLRTDGMYEPRGPMPGARGQVFPLVFAAHLVHDAQSRDFCCNANFYDPQTHQLIDATGYGVEDALAKRLRLASDKYVAKNHKLALRYCKYRTRGFHSDAATRQAMRDNAATAFGMRAQGLILLHSMLPKGDEADEVWARWSDVMRREGWGDLLKHDLQPTFAALGAYRSAAK